MALRCSRFVWSFTRIRKTSLVNHGYKYLTTKPTPSIEGKRMLTVPELLEKLAILTKKDDQMAYIPPAPKSQDGLEPRTMSESYVECFIDLQDPEIARRYDNFLGGLRIGRILEDLDIVAAACCFQHNKPRTAQERSPMIMVTSMTEKLEVNTSKVDMKCSSVKLCGQVTWTGRSSMEVLLWVILVNLKDGWTESPMMNSVFIMSARDCKDKSAACVHPLVGTNGEEDATIKEGRKRHERRKLISSDRYWKSPPDDGEIRRIHNLFVESLDPDAVSLSDFKLPPDCEWMENTKRITTVPTPADVCSIYGTVFGGYVMRTAAEAAFTAGAIFSKSPVLISHVSDIQFKAPCPAASLLTFTAEVAYTEENKMHIRVQTDVTDMKLKFTTNTSYWIAVCPQKLLPRVMPKTYGEYMLYLDARRRFKEVMGHTTDN